MIVVLKNDLGWGKVEGFSVWSQFGPFMWINFNNAKTKIWGINDEVSFSTSENQSIQIQGNSYLCEITIQ